MDRMVLDLLTFTRLSHEAMVIEPVDVEAVIHEIIHGSPELQPPRAEIIIRSPLPKIMSNRASLIQCMTNLLDNAVKFVAPGVHPHVEVYAQPEGPTTRFFLQDNGVGIDSQDQGKLFRMFRRLRGNQYPGTGIGLAIVRKAVERMGGTVGLDSEPGRGTRFWLKLPSVVE